MVSLNINHSLFECAAKVWSLCNSQDKQNDDSYMKDDVGITGMEFSVSLLRLRHHLEFLRKWNTVYNNCSYTVHIISFLQMTDYNDI